MTYILSLDQGTGSSRAVVFNHQGKAIRIRQKELSQTYPRAMYVEQDPNLLVKTQIQVAQEVLKDANVSPNQVLAIGITNQRETTIVWNKQTGQAIYNAIVWQDQRTKEACQQMSTSNCELIRKKTGLIVDPYFSATKIRWILDHVPNARAMAEQGNLLFGTVDTWLIWNLTGGKAHITDVSNASRTMLLNIHTLQWDDELLNLFDIPKSILPKVTDSSGMLAQTDPQIFGSAIPISGIAGDQQAALFGQQCFNAGMAKNTYGTGCFMLMNTGDKVVRSQHGLLSTVAWKIGNDTTYALEGSVFIAGAAVKWLRDQLGLIETVSETSDIARSVPDNGGVYVIPAFSGLGAPYWNSEVNGSVSGLTLGTGKAHIVRATLESIAYRTKDVLDAMVHDSKIEIPFLAVDGGASNNDFLMQFQSDILQIPLGRPQDAESTALGAAFLAGLAVGFWEKDKLRQTIGKERLYGPKMPDYQAKYLYKEWKKQIDKILNVKG